MLHFPENFPTLYRKRLTENGQNYMKTRALNQWIVNQKKITLNKKCSLFNLTHHTLSSLSLGNNNHLFEAFTDQEN